MIKPALLQKGDTIGLVAPSKRVKEQHLRYIKNFSDFMAKLGINVQVAKNALKVGKFGYSCASPELKAEDINEMFANPDINAIWCIHGGASANQVLEFLDYGLIKKNPKIFMGKSNIDNLLMGVFAKTGLVGFHTPDPKIGNKKEMDFEYNKTWFRRRLMEGNKEIIPAGPEEWETIRGGKASGQLLGMNSTAILTLQGTEYCPDFNGAILGLEFYQSDFGEVFQQLGNMKQIGLFDKIKGIIIGNNYECDEFNELTVENAILEATKEYDFPILKIDEFGHYQPHAFFPIGGNIDMDADNKVLKLI